MLDPANSHQLKVEVAALVKARSRHVVEIYDVDLSPDGAITGIVIEHLTGRSYDEFFLEAAVDPDATTKLIYQVALGLSDLHAVGIVHRDLKIANFKGSSSGVVKLFDFGISGLSDPHVTTQNRGTFDYSAPEIYVEGSQVSSAADVYSLGVCCWKLISSHLPEPLLQRPPAQVGGQDSISLVAPYLDSGVASIIDQCLSVDPMKRPSAREVAERCEAALLRGKHKGAFTRTKTNAQIYELSASASSVKLSIPNLGEIRAAYSGYGFYVQGTVGDVYMNNAPIPSGTVLLDACVITFGSFAKGAEREYVSFLSSKPEVVL